MGAALGPATDAAVARGAAGPARVEDFAKAATKGDDSSDFPGTDVMQRMKHKRNDRKI